MAGGGQSSKRKLREGATQVPLAKPESELDAKTEDEDMEPDFEDWHYQIILVTSNKNLLRASWEWCVHNLNA